MARAIALLLLWVSAIQAAPVPTGPRSTTNSFSFGGDILNYDSAGTWKPIDPNWQFVDSGLQVTKGPYSAFVDTANGKIWYGYKNHYIGMEPFRLIWFRPADSTWTTIANADINMFVVGENDVTVPDPFGLGVELTYEYNPTQFFQGYTYTVAALDTLKKLYQAQGDNTLWFANVIRLDLSRTNASLKKLAQAFSGGELGDEDILTLEMDSASVYYEPSDVVWNGIDFLNQKQFRLRRRVVNIGGTWYMVELINPRQVDTLSGAIRHQASIVFQSTDDDTWAASMYGDSFGGTHYAHQNRGASIAIEVCFRFAGSPSEAISEAGIIMWPNYYDTLNARGVQPQWIDSAHLELWVVQDGDDTAYAINRVTERWDEGNSNGVAVNGVAAWWRADSNTVTTRTNFSVNDTLWTGYQTDTSWTNWQGDWPIVTPYDDSINCCSGTGYWAKFGNTLSATALKTACSLWLAQPSQNFGWIIRSKRVTGVTDNYTWFASDDNATVANRPKLTVYWTEATATSQGGQVAGGGTRGPN